MAIKNFIPTVWSENLYSSLDNHYIAVKHCSREFEGDIKSCGSKVKICGVGDVNNALSGATFTVTLRLTNPQTGETMTIDAYKKPSFSASKVLKDLINE